VLGTNSAPLTHRPKIAADADRRHKAAGESVVYHLLHSLISLERAALLRATASLKNQHNNSQRRRIPNLKAPATRNVIETCLLERISSFGRKISSTEVSRSYLSQLEKGAFNASLKIVGKLAAVLEVEPAELLKQPAKRKLRGRW
jgi:transcriptional regulator with XRE-family HTH domain